MGCEAFYQKMISDKLFPGQIADNETGYSYNWNRDYDSSIGRYVESDPIGLDGGDVNIYSYVGQNPVNYVDPEGLAGGKNGGDGSASGKGTSNPYKKCKPDPTDPRFLLCKDKCGKEKRVRNPDYKPKTAPPVPPVLPLVLPELLELLPLLAF